MFSTQERKALAQMSADFRRKADALDDVLGMNGHKPRKRRTLSPDARARIAAAQRKRWAKQRREK